MDIQSQNTVGAISDDQELAQALAGVNDTPVEMSYEETTTPSEDAPKTDVSDMSSSDMTSMQQASAEETPATMPEENTVVEPTIDFTMPEPTIAATEPMTMPEAAPVMSSFPSSGNGDLDSIKKDALIELKPLVDKLTIQPEEKFDIYLLLLRSTDDKSLIEPAHEIARNIPDETRRAQALLDIIKEIDYLSGNK